VVRTAHTSDAVFLLADSWAKSCGKTTVECQDTPGFIVNRLLVPNIAAAIMMVERGDASIADVDMAMRLGAGQPMGPCVASL
jgi:3-hydroxyacyl-CoA dehydrogenase